MAESDGGKAAQAMNAQDENSQVAGAQAASDSAATPAAEPAAEPTAPGGVGAFVEGGVERTNRGMHRLMGMSRYMAIVPCIALLVAAIALMLATLVSTVTVTIEAFEGTVELSDMMVEYVEFADFFLLAIVLYIMSVGLYSLFIDDTIEMPEWLEIHNLEDLKEKLIGVVVVVMGVFFLGKLIHGTAAQDLFYMGIGVAAVVLALAYFARFVIIGHHGEENGGAPSTIVVAHQTIDTPTSGDAEETAGKN